MPTVREARDITAVAKNAYELYRDGTALRRLIDESVDRLGDSELELTFSFEAEGRDLRALIALTQTIQLAVDAAAVAVRYDDAVAFRLSEFGQETSGWDNSLARSLALEPIVTLEIVQLEGGSFFGRLKAAFVDPDNRKILLSVATVASALIAILVPPLTLPGLIVTGVVGISDIITVVQDRRRQKRQDEAARRQQEVADDRQREAEQRAAEAVRRAEEAIKQAADAERRVDEIERQLARSEKRIQRQVDRMRDSDSMNEAMIIRVETKVETPSN